MSTQNGDTPEERLTSEEVAAKAQIRTRRLVASGSAGSVTQLIRVGTGLVLTAILVRHLGTTQYGLYATAVALTSWLGLSQLGLVPSTLNQVATERGLADIAHSRGAISTASGIQAIASASALSAILLAHLRYDVPRLLNAPLETPKITSSAILVLLVGSLISISLGLGGTAFDAHQRGYVSQAWEAAGLLLRLGFVAIVAFADGDFLMIALAVVAGPVVAGVGRFVHAFWIAYPEWAPRFRSISAQHARALLRSAVDFALIGGAGLIITSTDALVLAHTVGVDSVTPYVVALSLAQLPAIAVMLALNAAWPAYREAMTNDPTWVRSAHQLIQRGSIGLALASGVTIIFLGAPLIQRWAGPSAVPSRELLIALALAASIQTALLPSGRLLTSLGKTRLNAVVATANAAINLPVSIVLATRLGPPGVALGTAIGYAAVGWVLPVASRRALRSLHQP